MSFTEHHRSLDMLRRVTTQLATTDDFESVLQSIAGALVEHADAVLSRIFLLMSDAECPICRARVEAGTLDPVSEPALHCLAAGGRGEPSGPYHRVLVDSAIPVAEVARTGRAFLIEDWREDPRMLRDRDTMDRWAELGVRGVAGYPLRFRGEFLGAIGYIAKRRITTEESDLLGIFADQAAIAIKSAQLFRDLARYRDRLEIENAYLQAEVHSEGGFAGIVGDSPALKSVLRKVKQVAPVETTVLLTGETGTGKELIARALHDGSPRRERPMIKVNCGAIPQGVVESELFGYEKGAFTGALQRRIGRFELADRGTLFMDEVGELSLDTQVKLLRVLQEQEFERVGSTRSQQVDVRLVAATNRDLEREVAENRFRPDLYYRLSVFPIRIPPLRERPSDIPLLVRHFLAHFQRKLAKPLKAVTPESMSRLERYHWPGNIRELQNVLERACVLATGPVVELVDGLESASRGPTSDARSDDAIVSLEEMERAHIRRALAAAKGKVHGPAGAAALLGLNPSTLRSRISKLGIAKGTT